MGLVEQVCRFSFFMRFWYDNKKRPFRFEYCDLTITTTATTENADQIVNYKHYFNNEVRMLSSANIPKRSVAIAKEVREGIH